MTSPDDEYANSLMAAGGLLVSLPAELRPESILNAAGDVTNRIRIRFWFLRSPYVITVEREGDPSAISGGGQ